jgi:hypothetical protein
LILGLGKNVGRLVETDRYSAFCVQNIEVSLEIQRLTIKWPHWGKGGGGWPFTRRDDGALYMHGRTYTPNSRVEAPISNHLRGFVLDLEKHKVVQNFLV